jgi:hypothetical protein
MERVNLGSVIEQAITRVTRNRVGEQPPVLSALSSCRPSSKRSSDLADVDRALCAVNNTEIQ